MSPRDALKSALWTVLFSFIALFGVSLIGWIGDVTEWASSSGQAAFPSLSVLGYAAVAAFASASIGLVNFAVRFAQAKGVFGEKAQATGPSYDPTAPLPAAWRAGPPAG